MFFLFWAMRCQLDETVSQNVDQRCHINPLVGTLEPAKGLKTRATSMVFSNLPADLQIHQVSTFF